MKIVKDKMAATVNDVYSSAVMRQSYVFSFQSHICFRGSQEPD